MANDFRSHRVCRFTVKPDGSGYISRQQPEILTTAHVAFRPIDARMGPDGAIYIADWYNPIIQHGEVDFRDDRRDREHGRIWRVSFPGRPLDPWPDFSKASVEQLLGLLEDPALPIRQFARQALWRRGADAPDAVLEAYTAWSQEDGVSRLLELSWFNEVLGRSTPTQDAALADALNSVDPQARRTLLRSWWRRRSNLPPAEIRSLEQAVLGHVISDDPRVRLEAIVCAGQVDGDNRGDAVQAVLEATNRDVDDNLDFAIWQSTRKLDATESPGSILTSLTWNDRPQELARAVAAIGTNAAAEVAVEMLEAETATDNSTDESTDKSTDESTDKSTDALVSAVAVAGNADQLGRVVKSLLSTDAEHLSLQRLKPLLDRTSRDGTVPADVGGLVAKIAADTKGRANDAEWIGTLSKVAQAWRIGQLEEVLVDALPKTSGRPRERLIAALGSFDSPTARRTLSDLAGDDDVVTRIAATRAIAASRPQAAIGLIVALLQNDTTAEAGSDLVVSMLRRKEMPALLAAKIDAVGLDTDLARNLLRRVRSAGGDASLEQAIETAGKLQNASWTLTPELKSELLGLIKTAGSPSRGETVYRREKLQCINCHAIGSGGSLVGPNLISVGGSSQPDYILESLLQPSAKLKEGYTTTTLLTDEGEVINGIVVGRTDETLRLRLADGKEVQVAIEAIEQEKPGKSLMPEGLLDGLTKAELVDLAAFMVALGRDPAFMVSSEPLVRSFDTLIYTDEANRRLNRTSTDTAASDDPSMQWRRMTTRVNGTIAVSELDPFQQHRETPPTSFVRFAIDMPENGTAKIDLPTDGIEAWVDGKPTPVWNLTSLELGKGTHTIVLAIDRTRQSESFAIRVGGDAVEAK